MSPSVFQARADVRGPAKEARRGPSWRRRQGAPFPARRGEPGRRHGGRRRHHRLRFRCREGMFTVIFLLIVSYFISLEFVQKNVIKFCLEVGKTDHEGKYVLQMFFINS